MTTPVPHCVVKNSAFTTTGSQWILQDWHNRESLNCAEQAERATTAQNQSAFVCLT